MSLFLLFLSLSLQVASEELNDNTELHSLNVQFLDALSSQDLKRMKECWLPYSKFDTLLISMNPPPHWYEKLRSQNRKFIEERNAELETMLPGFIKFFRKMHGTNWKYTMESVTGEIVENEAVRKLRRFTIVFIVDGIEYSWELSSGVYYKREWFYFDLPNTRISQGNRILDI